MHNFVFRDFSEEIVCRPGKQRCGTCSIIMDFDFVPAIITKSISFTSTMHLRSKRKWTAKSNEEIEIIKIERKKRQAEKERKGRKEKLNTFWTLSYIIYLARHLATNRNISKLFNILRLSSVKRQLSFFIFNGVGFFYTIIIWDESLCCSFFRCC